MSMLFGVIFACICSLILKKLKDNEVVLHRVQEIIIIIIFGFIVYTLAEKMELSPILALQTNGICMAHYAFYNISFQAREESCLVTKFMTHLAEGFVFVYLGLTSVTYLTETVSWSFILYQLLILLFCRYVSIFGLCFIMEKLMKNSFKMKFSDKGIMTIAGTIRGCIAFGLAVSLEVENEFRKSIIVSSTLGLVMLTTLVFGAIMPFAIKFFKSFDEKKTEEIKMGVMEVIQDKHHVEHHTESNQSDDKIFEFMHPNFSEK